MSSHNEGSGNLHDAIESLLMMQIGNDSSSRDVFDSLVTIEACLRHQEVGNDGVVIKSIRDVLSSSISNCQQLETLISVLTFGMEQRHSYDDEAGLSQTMTQETWSSSYDSDDGMEIADEGEKLPINNTNAPKISLVPTSLVAATVYAQLLAHRGALAVGLVSMNSVAALVNVVNRWKVECCSYQHVKGNEAATVTKKIIRRKGNSFQNDSRLEMEEFVEFASLPVKRNRRTGTSRTRAVGNYMDSDDDDVVCGNDEEDESCSQNLMVLGIHMAQAVCKIPLQHEFSNSWNMEAVEVIIGGVTTLMTTLQALVCKRPTGTQEIFGIHGLQQTITDIVTEATDALTRSILVSEEVQVDEDNFLEEEESDEDSPLKSLSRRHDTTVATLRGFYPALSMKDTVPMGESGKVAAARLASTTLEQILQEICTDIQLHPNRWPKQMHFNRRCSVASTVPSTLPPSSMAAVSDMLSPATPKSTSKHLRIASTPPGNMMNSSQRRLSMTPKVKSKTPAIEPGSSMVVKLACRPGPVLSAIVGILQQMATLPGLQSSTLRTSVVGTIHRCMKNLPMQERTFFLQFVVKLCHSKLPVHRLVATELIGGVLSEDWVWTLDGRWEDDWEHLATSLGVLSPHPLHFVARSVSSRMPNNNPSTAATTLFGALKGRLSDRTPTIRSMSAGAISEVCRRIISSAFEKSLALSEFLLVLSAHVYDVIEVLRDRSVADDKATVRRASCIALVDILIVGIIVGDDDIFACSITEQDIAILSAACQESSLMVRRAAAEGLTSLLEYVTKSTDKESTRTTILLSLEKAWTVSTLPMVLDTETSCVNKATELVERLLLSPIATATDSMNSIPHYSETAKTTAWRILATLGEGTSNGSKRSENEALCKAVQDCIAASAGKEKHLSMESILKKIHVTAIDSLNPDDNDLFAPTTSDQRTGVWCLFNALIGKGAIPPDILRSMKTSKIDVSFLCSSWDALLQLFLSRHTPSQSKTALQNSMRYCLHILSQLAKLVDVGIAEGTSLKLQELLGNFLLPPEIIGSAVAATIATTIASCKDRSISDQYSRCKVWLHSIYKSCETSLSSQSLDTEGTSRVARILFTIGEISMIGFCASDDGSEADFAANCQVGNGHETVLVRGMNERPSKQLIEYVQAFMTDSLPVGLFGYSKATPVSLRAHAFVALGKVCLRDANLAKQSLNVLARELRDSIKSDNWAVQSNSLLILGDLCVKYTNMVDRFLPVMASCLQAGTTAAREGAVRSPDNGSALVRKHAVLLLSSLILQDYVKWRGLLFHRLLVASVDDDDEVACLAEMVLFGPLLSKQPRLFANQFVESIFVLNCCTDHPIFKAAAVMGDGGSGISVGFDGIDVKGDTGRMKRMQMYQMMLSKMSDEDKIGITARIGKEILGGALKSGSELNIVATTTCDTSNPSCGYDAAFNVLSDALLVLKCPQIRVGRSNRNVEDDIEDPNVSVSNTKRALVAKGRLLSNVSRKHLIEILIPILCNLKSALEKSRSPLLNDVMIYLLDVYQRHKSEARECLANDPTTLHEIEYDAQQQQLKLRQRRRLSSVSTTSDSQ